ncbi:pyridoxamine 5'-phosphate oxidase family protein [Rariglobus hedericola]|uniref:Pyridoxamine 5'-phosphate oxidase family protein n=1 Tax=Rariglobus hedericola TaxID=2597822 RepID=A0A556QS72_9BACT|nr:pyridoxamine 5'-phosphate oxidase family protein [Rariglobus hedericola]TSJ79488.1 pyridoxamine 5'-phosphate oxidase family protein [Rariglobus hedericola]
MTQLASTPSTLRPEGYPRLCELIKDIDFTMFTTVAEDGSLHSRPMATMQLDADRAELWFFTSIDSPKVAEIYHERTVGLSYASPGKNNYVSVSGRAYIVRDTDKVTELWTPAAKIWFPQGVNDPHLVLLRVVIESAQFWDSPSSMVVQLWGLAKMALTGHAPENLGENVKVNVR